MLAVHILNVGHGDSIVLEFKEPDHPPAFAVVDSNTMGEEDPKALKKLESLGATELSFVAITHPHSDHYLGMSKILAKYDGKIGHLYTFPIEPAYADKYQRAARARMDAVDNEGISRSLLELMKIISYGKKIIPHWITETSTHHPIEATGFVGVQFEQILPPGKVKAPLVEAIEKGNVDFPASHQNDLSLAIALQYRGHEIVLAGDGTKSNWLYQDTRWQRLGFALRPTAVKLPHHGSATDSDTRVLDVLFGNSTQPDRIACISANGKSHPHKSVIDDLVARQIKPYCTNLAVRCGADRRARIQADDCSPALARFLEAIIDDASDSSQPCQGDITIRIDDSGVLSVSTEFANLCPFRGDYDRLFPGGLQ